MSGRRWSATDKVPSPHSAKAAADQLQKETDDKAKGIVDEASRRADSLIAGARKQAGLR